MDQVVYPNIVEIEEMDSESIAEMLQSLGHYMSLDMLLDMTLDELKEELRAYIRLINEI